MKLSLVGLLVVSEYTPVEAVTGTGMPAFMQAAKKLKFPRSDKDFPLVEIPVSSVININDPNTRDVYRSCMRNINIGKPPIFKAFDTEIECNVLVTIWRKKLYLIGTPLSNVLDCITGDDFNYGVVSGRRPFTYIQGKFSYNGNWNRFMATYPEIENVSPIYEELHNVQSKTVFDTVPSVAVNNDDVNEVIAKCINTPSKVCKAACIIDDVVWLIYRKSTSDQFIHAKLHDVLVTLVDWHERDPDEPIITAELPAPPTIQDKFNALKGTAPKAAVPDTPNTNDTKDKPVMVPNAKIKLPSGSARKFESPFLSEAVVDALLAATKQEDIIIGIAPKIVSLKKAVPNHSCGAYHISGFGIYGRAMLSEEQLKTVKRWLGGYTAIAYKGENFKLYYDKDVDAQAIYVTGTELAYYTDKPVPAKPVQKQTTQSTQQETQETVMATNTTATTTTITAIDLADCTQATRDAVSHIESFLKQTVMSVDLTDVKAYPTALDGIWSIVNAGEYSNKIVGTRIAKGAELDGIEEGVLVVTPTTSYLGTEFGTFKFDTAIVLPEPPKVETVEVEKIVEVPATLTDDELVERLLESVKAGTIDPMVLIGKVTTARM